MKYSGDFELIAGGDRYWGSVERGYFREGDIDDDYETKIFLQLALAPETWERYNIQPSVSYICATEHSPNSWDDIEVVMVPHDDSPHCDNQILGELEDITITP